MAFDISYLRTLRPNVILQDRNTEHSESLNYILSLWHQGPGEFSVQLSDGNHWAGGFLLSLIIIQYKFGDFQKLKNKIQQLHTIFILRAKHKANHPAEGAGGQ